MDLHISTAEPLGRPVVRTWLRYLKAGRDGRRSNGSGLGFWEYVLWMVGSEANMTSVLVIRAPEQPARSLLFVPGLHAKQGFAA